MTLAELRKALVLLDTTQFASILAKVRAGTALVDLDETFSYGRSLMWGLIHMAASNNRMDVVQLLLDHGADVNCWSEDEERDTDMGYA